VSNTKFRSAGIRVSGIVNDSIVDGPGLRMAIFMQGCDKNCAGCHNQAARSLTGGTEYTAAELVEKIRANPLLTGVTFSGGEPLLQAEALIPLAEQIAAAKLPLAIYTGDVLEDVLLKDDAHVLRLLHLADILIDGPFILKARSLALPFRGSHNQRILDVKQSLAARRAVPTNDPAWKYV
jgi:anaerobic ribonucleoside-triphosphate reductase activating protein